MTEKRLDLDFFFNLKRRKEKGGNFLVIEWCMKKGLIASCYKCPECGKFMKLSPSETVDEYVWKCRGFNDDHKFKRSIRKGSWFSHDMLPMIDILLLTYMLIRGFTHDTIMYELNLGSAVVSEWRDLFRAACLNMCLKENLMMGGSGKIVEVDLNKFFNGNHNKGKKVNVNWVLGGIERGSGLCFFKVVNKPDRETIREIIKQNVVTGTTIITNGADVYKSLVEDGFIHLTVDHRQHFKDPKTGAHINSIQGSWTAIKRKLSYSSVKGHFDFYLAEYVWKKKNLYKDQMTLFIEGIIKLYPPQTCDAAVKYEY